MDKALGMEKKTEYGKEMWYGDELKEQETKQENMQKGGWDQARKKS